MQPLSLPESYEHRASAAPVSFEKRTRLAAPPQIPVSAPLSAPQLPQSQPLQAPQTSSAPQAEQMMPSSHEKAGEIPETVPGSEKRQGGHKKMVATQGSEGLPRRRRRSAITGAAFMNAFKQSIKTDRETRSAYNNGIEHVSSEPQSSAAQTRALVQERLDDWLTRHYVDRIMRALAQESQFHAKYMKPLNSLTKTVLLEIPIEKDGRVRQLPENLTGIPEIDEFLTKLLKSADFPPIPTSFKRDRFVFKTQLNIRLDQGGFYKLEVA